MKVLFRKSQFGYQVSYQKEVPFHLEHNTQVFNVQRKYPIQKVEEAKEIDYDRETEIDNTYLNCYKKHNSVSNFKKCKEEPKVSIKQAYTSKEEKIINDYDKEEATNGHNVVNYSPKKVERKNCTSFVKRPIERSEWMRLSLEREIENKHKKVVYKVYLSDDNTVNKQMIMYAVRAKNGNYYIGSGDQYDINLGNKNNKNYLAKINCSFFGKEFLLYQKENDKKYNACAMKYVNLYIISLYRNQIYLEINREGKFIYIFQK